VCGRFNVAHTPGLQGLIDRLGIDLELPPAQFNVAPTEDVLLLHDGRGERARWWLTPSWAKQVDQKYSMFNARCETLAESPAFRVPFRHQRGIVPMSSFIEWRTEQSGRQPWLVTNDEAAIAVAALWDVWRGGEEPLLSCTLVTTDGAAEFLPWHRRMPLLLAPEECERWLDNEQPVALDDPLFEPRLKYPLRLYPLSRAVGNARNKSARLMAPAGDEVRLEAGQGADAGG
jgi:putative SOS response-associated peptidase YedK